MPKTGKVVVITGPSGVGKSTILREVLRRTGALFSVSATTRPVRPEEVDGRDYRFVSRRTFEKMLAEAELFEWAEVFGEYYGTPAGPVEQAMADGKTMLLEIDVQGGMQVHEKMPEATFVLILPPGRGELKRRLAARATERPEVIESRFTRAQEEVLAAQRSGIYTHTVVNDDLAQAIDTVVGIVEQEQGQT